MATTVELVCERCGEVYTRHPSQSGSSKYCSNDCQYAYDERVTATEHPPQSTWKDLCQSVKERDGFVCQMCLSERKKFNIHHIKPLSRGGSNETSNLVLLCEACHGSIHASGDVYNNAQLNRFLKPE